MAPRALMQIRSNVMEIPCFFINAEKEPDSDIIILLLFYL